MCPPLSALSPSGPTVMTEAVAEERRRDPCSPRWTDLSFPLGSLMLETAKRGG